MGDEIESSLPLSPSSLLSFLFFVNFSPALYYPNAWNRLDVIRLSNSIHLKIGNNFKCVLSIS